ncbi:hypothetical protein [Actinoplanes friuliensis]|uniref:hypothetical protein n=1 Tax=Actinoplanes friuliensis TaxID=196914 RepID=UPI0011DE3652|nr:hypothetical protein [Actinoplanes friuliensis]
MGKTIVVRITVVADDETASDEAMHKLLDELHDFDDIVSVEQATRPGEAPDGAKSAELLAVGTLLLTIVAQPEVLTHLLTYVADWRRRQGRKGRGRIELRTPRGELILTNATDAQADQLIKTFIEEVIDPDS